MSRLGWLILILFITAGVYVGNQVIPFYYYYHELEGLMRFQAKKAQALSDGEIRENLVRKIKKLELPVDDMDNLRIQRKARTMIIDLEYTEVLYVDVSFLNEFYDMPQGGVYDIWVFNFNPHVEEKF